VVTVLEAVRITGRSYCGARVAESAETATLWEEVRAALTATRLSREGHGFPVTITSFKRTLDPTTFDVRTEERRYLICDVPSGRYRLTLEGETGDVAETDVVVEAGRLVMREMTLTK
jgi:hypothetical protein